MDLGGEHLEKARRNTPRKPSNLRVLSDKRFCILTPRLTASLAVLVVAAVTYVVAMTTQNWSTYGVTMKMGLWEFCVVFVGNATWSCLQVISGNYYVC